MKNWRINIIFLCILLFGAAIIGRLFYLQVIKYDYYKALAYGQQKDFKFLKGERGQIFFKSGQTLATNIKGRYVFASPVKIKNKEETAKNLSEILNIDENQILESLNKESSFEIIKNNLTSEEETKIKNKNLEGVYLDNNILRKYPQKEIASRTIGFLGANGKGQYGVEGYYDEILRGKDFFPKKERYGISIYDDELKNLKGADIYLTLDYNIQVIAEKLLEKAKEDIDIEGGLIIVMEPSTGKILALANFPNFDPNNYSKVKDFEIFQNDAVQKLFEPGSLFKVITMAAALNEGKITPQTKYIDNGYVKIGKYTIYNYNQKVWGEKTMTEVLQNSINTGAIFAERKLGHENFLKYVEKFGFFKPTGIDIFGEIYSENKEFKKGYEVNFATASFGQGIEITPIQLVKAFSAIANNGKMVKPHIAEKIYKNGKTEEVLNKVDDNEIISLDTVSQITTMMVNVVENSYSGHAKIPGYYIAGKTGTAQIPYSSLGINMRGYSEKTWQSFIGFAPAFNPKFLVLVKLDNPKTKDASQSAVPIFRDLAKYIIDYFEIPPDYEVE